LNTVSDVFIDPRFFFHHEGSGWEPIPTGSTEEAAEGIDVNQGVSGQEQEFENSSAQNMVFGLPVEHL